MYVFRFGKIYNYDEENADNAWCYDKILIAASHYATSCYLGYSEDVAYSLSYMYVSMINQPELTYSKEHTKILDTITRRVERA